MRTLLLALALLLPAAAAGAGPRVLEGPAIVRSDGTLWVDGAVVRLHGIYLPRLMRTCSSLLDPTFCAPAAVVVLFEKIRGFLVCHEVRTLADGSVDAYCGMRADRLFDPREDVGAMLVEEGFALAAPDAPPEYRVLERLAESRGVGLWGEKMLRVR
ncbi:MAG: hypothetical protein U1E14_17200 [Geminicoccaceae bacterium]